MLNTIQHEKCIKTLEDKFCRVSPRGQWPHFHTGVCMEGQIQTKRMDLVKVLHAKIFEEFTSPTQKHRIALLVDSRDL